MSYELRDHTADVAVAATAGTLGETFAAVADGLASAMADSIPPGGDRFQLEVTAENREALLFDYLDELIYERDVRGVLPVDNEATVQQLESSDAWTLSGSARGVPLADVVGRDIKAVTYAEMSIEPTETGWEAYVVFDV